MPRENFLLRVWCSENICYVYLLSCCDCVGLDVYYYCKIKIHDKEIWIIGGITKNQDRVETIISGYQSWVCWHLQLPDKLWIHIIKRSGVLKCCQGFWSQQSFHGLQDDREGGQSGIKSKTTDQAIQDKFLMKILVSSSSSSSSVRVGRWIMTALLGGVSFMNAGFVGFRQG